MRELVPACPPVAVPSTVSTRSPSAPSVRGGRRLATEHPTDDPALPDDPITGRLIEALQIHSDHRLGFDLGYIASTLNNHTDIARELTRLFKTRFYLARKLSGDDLEDKQLRLEQAILSAGRFLKETGITFARWQQQARLLEFEFLVRRAELRRGHAGHRRRGAARARVRLGVDEVDLRVLRDPAREVGERAAEEADRGVARSG